MNELIKTLTTQLNISDEQAGGGLAAIMNIAQKFSGADFDQVSKALPGIKDLMAQAPADKSSLGGMFGGVMSALGQGDSSVALLAKVATQFNSLGLDPALIGKFLPVVVGFLRNNNNSAAADLLQKVVSQIKL